MDTILIKTLENIFFDLNKEPPSNMSLFSGECGLLLFNLLYTDLKQDINEQKKLENRIQSFCERSLVFGAPTFAEGLAGVYWFFNYLRKRRILDRETIDILCTKIDILQKLSLEMIEVGVYDLLHGGLGIAYSLIDFNLKNKDYFDLVLKHIDALFKKSISNKFIPSYDFSEKSINPNEANLGLAHGIPSVIKFCLLCYKKNLYPQKSKEIMDKLIIFILSNKNNDTNYCFFPTFFNNISPIHNNSRLAWCYGDLSVGYILYQCGTYLQDKRLMSFALTVLLSSTKRRSQEETSILDATFCHGSSGPAYIYRKLWYLTKEPLFKDAGDFWIKETMSYCKYEDGIGGFKSFYPLRSEQKLSNDSGLLSGSIGIGLTLMSYITNNFTWDECLFLS